MKLMMTLEYQLKDYLQDPWLIFQMILKMKMIMQLDGNGRKATNILTEVVTPMIPQGL